jgi:hypothetical protein
MTLKIAVVHEASADHQTATELADRVLVETIDWLDNESVVFQRVWLTGRVPLTWKQIKQLARDAGIIARGFFEGKPGLADAQAARRAILYLQREFPDLSGVLLIRDQDDQSERRKGLEQARTEHHGAPLIVVGLAIVERECWVVSGFDPANEAEAGRLDAERNRLGFDPRLRSHELTACKNDQAIRSPKRVLRQLSGGDVNRERRCWLETDLKTLRERGGENGLAEYLEEIQSKLASLVGSPS